MKYDKFSAFISLRPNSSFEIHEDGTVNWLDETTTMPTDAEVEVEIARLEAQYVIDQENKKVAKQAAEYKLAKLGLTPDDLKAILG
jgi:hypothetical protein